MRRGGRHVPVEPSRPPTQQAQRDAHGVHVPEYLLLDEVARLLRFDVTAPRKTRGACWQYLKRHAVPVLRRGRVLLVERRMIDAVLRET